MADLCLSPMLAWLWQYGAYRMSYCADHSLSPVTLLPYHFTSSVSLRVTNSSQQHPEDKERLVSERAPASSVPGQGPGPPRVLPLRAGGPEGLAPPALWQPPRLQWGQCGPGHGELPQQGLWGGHPQWQHGCSGTWGEVRDAECFLFALWNPIRSLHTHSPPPPLQDGCGLQLPTAYEPEPLAKYGTLDVAFEYDSGEQWLAVTVTAATDIPALKQTGNISWQVHLVLLPTKKQRAKTGVQKGPCPIFTETFKFSRVEQEALGDYAVRFRLYSVRRMKKEKVLGEKVFYLTKLNLQGKIALPVTLEPGSELAVRTLHILQCAQFWSDKLNSSPKAVQLTWSRSYLWKLVTWF